LSVATAAPALRPRRWLATAGTALLVVLLIAPVASATGRGARMGASFTAVGPRLDAPPTRLEGIDVSHWQNTITWSKVAAAGKSFAIIKATEDTTYVDPQYATNHSGAKAVGIWTGAYHFAQPDATPNDAILEADHFASVINLGAGDLIPALDLEVSGGLSIVDLQTWVKTWLDEVTLQAGVRPMIYTSPAFWKKYMGDSSALADAGYKTLWVAHWNVADPWVPANKWGGNGWTFWQYSNNGHVPGINARVDLDRFNGLDLMPVAFSSFKLAASVPSGFVKQGQSSAAVVKILRTNFSSAINLDVAGLPTGTTVAYDANPTGDTSAALTVTTPTDPTATPTGTYPLTITGVAEGLTRTTAVNLVVIDGIPPTLVAPFTALSAGTLGTSTVLVRVSWSASDPSRVVSGALQRSINGGAWRGVRLPSGNARTLIESLPLGKSVQQQARATDGKANTSPWTPGPIVRTTIAQQQSAGVTYSRRWHSTASRSASGGSLRYSTAAGAMATYRFTGSSIAWVSTKGPDRGSAKVYVDGVYARTVDLHASSGHARSIVFARNWLTNGVHVLQIQVVGTPGHPRVDVDAVVRLSLS
jgi:GH25 family lysozyme M1 (1,4-beta-N-acetylmuramidase)